MSKIEQSTKKAHTRVRAVLALPLAVVALTFTVAPAFASSPPSLSFGTALTRGSGTLTQTSSGPFAIEVCPEGLETRWGLDWAVAEDGHAPVESSPSWAEVPGGNGSVPGTGLCSEHLVESGVLSGLDPETLYYVRWTAANADGSASPEFNFFETKHTTPVVGLGSGEIAATGETTAHLSGFVRPEGSETHWRFEYSTTSILGGSWTVVPGGEGTVAVAEKELTVTADLAGLIPGTVYYVRLFAENEHGEGKFCFSPNAGVPAACEQVSHQATHLGSFETDGPPSVIAEAVHSFHGETIRAFGLVKPHGRDTGYYFEYVDQEGFEAAGFAGATRTPEVSVGTTEGIVGADLPGMRAGEVYHFRLVGVNESEGHVKRVVDGSEQVVMAPSPGSGEESSCPNQTLRTGPSASLPDCRAYEQVTPADKEGAMDIFTYGNLEDYAWVGEDGDRVMLNAPGTQWGASTDASQSTYVFSRDPEEGWQTMSITPQPGAGVEHFEPFPLSPDLTEIGTEAGSVSSLFTKSALVTLGVGAPGGPYQTVATVQRGNANETGGSDWVASSAEANKFILATDDHEVLGHRTGTVSGNDLYEYSSVSGLRQVNVESNGQTIGSCGAQLARGSEGYHGTAPQNDLPGTPDDVSADGSRVFFYAGFGGDCPTAEELGLSGSGTNLYVHTNGIETVDIGAYRFLAANPEGSKLLLERSGDETSSIYLYETESGTQKLLLTTRGDVVKSNMFVTSSDLADFYFDSEEQLTADAPPIPGGGGQFADIYRYDASTGTLSYVAQIVVAQKVARGGDFSVSPDGNDLYIEGELVGLPSGGNPNEVSGDSQVYRYDAAESVIQCMSCASTFDPEPRLPALYMHNQPSKGDDVPDQWATSENGDYVFFETNAALVSQDIDGEISSQEQATKTSGGASGLNVVTPSTDVYEWRHNGVDGCTHVQGCVALISSGRGGYKVELLGTTPSGDDVFFATHESLVPSDTDTAGDIYDARIGGGFAPLPARPVECEGDACSTPVSAPVDTTPASFTFSGIGNVTAELPAKPVVKSKTPKKARKKAKAKKKQRKAKKSGKKARKSDDRRGR